MKENKSIVRFVRESPMNPRFFYADMELPAAQIQIRDALHKARWIEGEADYKEIYFTDCPLLPELVDIQISEADIREINFFAKRLEMLTKKELIAMKAIVGQNLKNGKYRDGISAKELINQTYGLDHVMVASNVSNDEFLGQFVIENELQEDVASVPDNALYLLDKERIGRLQRYIDEGVFIDGCYVAAGDYELPKRYDGEHLPDTEEMMDAVFRLEVGNVFVDDSEKAQKGVLWIELPIDNEEIKEMKKEYFNGHSIEECVYFGFETAIPMIDKEMFGDMSNFQILNSIAQRYFCMDEEDKIKYKAVMESENVTDIREAFDIAENISQYELAYYCADEAEFFMEHLLHHIDTDYDSNWFANLLVKRGGAKLLERLNAKCTNYGVVSARGISLYSPVTVDEMKEKTDEDFIQEEEEEIQNLGGMQL